MKRRFNIIYNDNKNICMGKGYYIIYENRNGEPRFDSKYGTIEYNKDVDMISVGILNRINYLYDLGYVLDKYYNVDLEKIF